MPEIQPFAAIRYDHTKTGGDLSALVAPPYDVLDQTDKDALLNKNICNVVAIDLPHIPPKSAGPVEVYEQAANTMQQWLNEGTLIRETEPALYLYHQTFEHQGKNYTRKKFIARVRLSEFSEGQVLPHEKTFGGPKEDRLALMKATKCQLSPIFGLFADPEARINRAYASIESQPPAAIAKLDGVENKTWIVTEPGVIDEVVTTMADKKIYIADGHHRYSTALMYRAWAKKQNDGPLPDDHPANYVMFVLASMDDPGCLILPYYRTIGNVNTETLLDVWKEGVEIATSDTDTLPAPPLSKGGNHGDAPSSTESTTPTTESTTPPFDKGGLGGVDLVLHDGSGKETPLKFSNRSILKSLEPGECEAWSQLDYAYLHRYLIDELLAKKTGESPKVHYVKSREDANETAKNENGVALLINATPMAHLRAVSEQGGLMPQKSTYFYPKLATGITLNPLA